ncbi:MAG TPA: tripartite tricarboxylate transporter TctB family protein [Methylomirabilota bacterium]|nr:tripartite tricarboxylate transporter TctB family protein [Methylomirabilota bacterium]
MAALARAAAPLAGLSAALALLAVTRGLDDVAREGQLGPGFWPRLVLAGLAVTCAARLVLAWWAGATRDAGSDAGAMALPSRLRLAAAVALILLYVVAAPVIGFPLATAAFVAGFMTVSGARSPGGAAVAAVGGTVGLLYLFVKVVYLPLPKGAGPFEAVTLALYRALGIF